MQIGKVIGTVVATRKDDTLVGSKLMITQPLNFKNESEGKPLIAVDMVGAGIGELVIYTEGTAARNAAKK
ncbi:EutN/CcmL family microcompartment protein, partial [Romboutsia sp.]|uniref:EutN/CcmL family microcompartment protein n=1 Tax=Romboutsia sp. TaxID=1965302 RepID=UPI002C5A876F